MSDRRSAFGTLFEALELMVKSRKELYRVAFLFVLADFLYIVRFRLADPTGGGLPGNHWALLGEPGESESWLGLFAVIYLFSVFAVAWHRTILLGSSGAGGIFGVRFGLRELRYFGLVCLTILLAMLAGMFLFALASLLGAGFAAAAASVILLLRIASALAIAYIAGRVGLAFAALSIDQPLGLHGSWKSTAGQGFGIFAANFVSVIVGCLGLLGLIWFGRNFGIGRYAPYFSLLLLSMLVAAFLGLVITVNALAFDRLGRIKAPLRYER
jgi:hypothetical protein